MDFALLSEGGKVFVAQGVLGVIALVQAFVIWRLYTDKEAAAREKQDTMIKSIEVLSELSHSIEERNKVQDTMASSITELASAFKALGTLLDAQHARVLDRASEVMRTLEKRSPRGGP